MNLWWFTAEIQGWTYPNLCWFTTGMIISYESADLQQGWTSSVNLCWFTTGTNFSCEFVDLQQGWTSPVNLLIYNSDEHLLWICWFTAGMNISCESLLIYDRDKDMSISCESMVIYDRDMGMNISCEYGNLFVNFEIDLDVWLKHILCSCS